MQASNPRSVRVRDGDDLPRVLEAAGLSSGPVLVLVGGAGGLEAGDEAQLAELIRDYLVPVMVRNGGSVVDGGTDSGIMRAIGSARSDAGAQFPLIGVASVGTVRSSDSTPAAESQAEVDPNHTHIVLVPGQEWGDESPWLSEVASALSRGHRSATMLVNGGEIAYRDVHHSLKAGRPVIVLAGSGRTADAIASAASDPSAEERSARIAASPLVVFVSVDEPAALSAVLAEILAEPTSAR
jgi:hypothetical protein